jgi:surfactin family lipopeptide synthetase C
MKPTDIEDIYDLSPMQAGMLFHKLRSPQDELYNVQVTCAIRGDLDTIVFHRAWQMIVERHTMLRTAFVWENIAHPVQVVCRAVALPWREEDWRGMPDAERGAQLNALLSQDRAEGFDLKAAPLMRFVLVRLADDNYRFIWSFHHMLLDGWSTSLVLKEAFAWYEHLVRGEYAHLEPNRSYRDYIAWLKAQSLSAAEQFWRQELHGFAELTPLGIDRLFAALPHAASDLAELRCCLSETATQALIGLARQHKLTLNTVVQGAWAILLSRYSDMADVVFGATAAVRPVDLDGVESLVGLLINTLPVRVQVDVNVALIPWLASLQARQSAARQYDYAPLVDVQRWSEVPAASPLFESLVVFESYPTDIAAAEPSSAQVAVQDVCVFERTNYPLTIVVGMASVLTLKILYDPARIRAATAACVAAQMQTLLQAIAANPDARLGALSPLSDKERADVVERWNATAQAYPREATVDVLVTEHARRSPHAVAVSCGGCELTYGELDRRANQMAHALRARGVGPDVLVGIALERSLDLVVSLLGILKAGGAYVPLDPAYPPERLRFMAKDAGIAMVLTQAALADSLPLPPEVPTLELDGTFAQELLMAPTTALVSGAVSSNLVYVSYTSGSTGRPKGVAIPHRGVVRLVRGSNYARFAPDEVFLHLAPLGFDLSAFEIWGALANGARLVPFPAQLPSLEAIGEIIHTEGVTTLWLTAGLFHQMVDERLEDLRPLRQLLAGGDSLSITHVQRAARALPECRLINGYGPTESTTFTCCNPLVEPDQLGESVPLGPPIANTQVYVLDADMAPLGVAIPGELYIGGDGLARGYLGRPALTAERFVPNPFGVVPGERLYRTGDRACWRPDETIAFLGRLDNQVKIRGFRIEPGEIEATLRQHARVRDAVVAVRQSAGGNKRLVAYVLPNREQGTGNRGEEAVPSLLSPAELRAHLKERLPDYMMPSTFVVLDTFPLTPNGKVDRAALPDPQQAAPEERAYVAPRTPMEILLAGIWAELLTVQCVGIYDNFFEIGGHSLLATRLISRVRAICQVDISLRSLFEEPTIAAFARAIDQLQSHSSRPQGTTIQPVRRGAYRMTRGNHLNIRS